MAGERTGQVLVVEDDSTIRGIEAEVLRLGGYTVVEAEDAATALALLMAEGHAIVLALLDIRLPGMTGVEAVGQLRSRAETRAFPVILGTGDEEVGARVAGLRAGADDYVIKPFSPDELLARVDARI